MLHLIIPNFSLIVHLYIVYFLYVLHDLFICVIMLTNIIVSLLWNVFSLYLHDYGRSTVINLLEYLCSISIWPYYMSKQQQVLIICICIHVYYLFISNNYFHTCSSHDVWTVCACFICVVYWRYCLYFQNKHYNTILN